MATNEHELPAPWLAALPTELHDAAAEQLRFWDDPDTEAERQRLWDAMAELGKVQREIAVLKDSEPDTAEKMLAHDEALQRRQQRERELLAEIDGEPGAHQGEDAGPVPESLTQMKRAAIIERLGRRYPSLESALGRPEEWAKACRVPERTGWYYLERIEAECRARYGGAAPASSPAADLSAAEQLRRIG